MVKRKLKRLKKAEENRIISEHEGLYNRLIAENYAPAEGRAEEQRQSDNYVSRRLGFNRWAVASFVLAGIIAVGGLFMIVGKGRFDVAVNDAPSVAGQVEEVTVTALEQSLDCTSLNTSALGIKKINAVYGAQQADYYTVEVDTFHTLELIVKVNPDCDVPEIAKPSANADTTVNRHGFSVNYTVTRRRLEDYFMFNTKAMVTTDSEVYYIRYNYSSISPTCELLSMIEECITPKA